MSLNPTILLLIVLAPLFGALVAGLFRNQVGRARSIAVEVQVVYFRIRVIQPLLKIFRRRELLEQLKRALQAEIIPGNLRICVLGKSRYHSKQHDSNHR